MQPNGGFLAAALILVPFFIVPFLIKLTTFPASKCSTFAHSPPKFDFSLLFNKYLPENETILFIGTAKKANLLLSAKRYNLDTPVRGKKILAAGKFMQN